MEGNPLTDSLAILMPDNDNFQRYRGFAPVHVPGESDESSKVTIVPWQAIITRAPTNQKRILRLTVGEFPPQVITALLGGRKKRGKCLKINYSSSKSEELLVGGTRRIRPDDYISTFETIDKLFPNDQDIKYSGTNLLAYLPTKGCSHVTTADGSFFLNKKSDKYAELSWSTNPMEQVPAQNVLIGFPSFAYTLARSALEERTNLEAFLQENGGKVTLPRLVVDNARRFLVDQLGISYRAARPF